MKATRRGKIARLPHAVREQLNRRLHDGAQGKALVKWLNRLPEVHIALAREFAGRPIREQNLSEWKQGGYREWLRQQEAMECAGRFREEAGELRGKDGENGGALVEDMAVWILARLMAALRGQTGEEAGGGPDIRMLRQVCGDIVALRRGEHQAERLRMERERVAMDWKRLEFDGERVSLQKHFGMGRFKRRTIVGLETLMSLSKKDPKVKAAMDALVDACGGIFGKMEMEMDKPAAEPKENPKP
ncbi:MAG: hypothetical protein WCK55_05975 [Verrucomicrobiota bacterium]